MERKGGKSSPASWLAGLGRIAHNRDYLTISVLLFVLGVATGAVIPYVALWVTGLLHGTTWQAAFIFVPYGIVGTLVNTAASGYSDRVSRRKGAILLSLLTSSAAELGLALTTGYEAAVVLFAFTSFQPFGLVFALVRDTIRKKQGAGEDTGGSEGFITTLIRSFYSLGWLLGPVIGAFLIEVVHYRGLFVVSALLLLLAAFWTWRYIGDQPHHPTGVDKLRVTTALRARELGLLVLLFALGLFLMTGDVGRSTYLTLYLTNSIGLPLTAVSLTFSISIFSELPLLPLAGRLADRFGIVRITLLGIAAQVVYFFGLSAVSGYPLILVLQVMYAFVISVSSGVAILFAQRTLSTERTGLSTSTYLASRGLAPLVTSALVGLSIVGGELHRLFAAFGFFGCGALALAIILASMHRRTETAAASP